MPTNPIILANDSIVEVRAIYEMFGQKILNVRHYRAVNVPTNSQFIPAAETLDEKLQEQFGWLQLVNGMQSQNCEHLRTDYQIVYPFRYSYLSLIGLGVGKEGTTQGTLPPNDSLSITLLTNTPRKGGKGGIRLGGIPSRALAAGRVIPEFANKLVLIGAALKKEQDLPSGALLEPIVYNRRFPTLSNTITITRWQSTSRVMRRRTVGLGI